MLISITTSRFFSYYYKATLLRLRFVILFLSHIFSLLVLLHSTTILHSASTFEPVSPPTQFYVAIIFEKILEESFSEQCDIGLHR